MAEKKNAEPGNEKTRRGRRPRIHLMAAAVVACVAVLAAGCGGDEPSNKAGKAPAGQTAQGRHDQALAYSKCMRENGVADWPDPSSNGAFPNENGSLTKIRNSPQFKKAADACKGFEVGGAPDAAQIEAEFAKLLKYSKCMRENGVPNFPDPKKEKGGVGIGVSEGIDQNSAAYKKADNACKAFQPGGGG